MIYNLTAKKIIPGIVVALMLAVPSFQSQAGSAGFNSSVTINSATKNASIGVKKYKKRPRHRSRSGVRSKRERAQALLPRPVYVPNVNNPPVAKGAPAAKSRPVNRKRYRSFRTSRNLNKRSRSYKRGKNRNIRNRNRGSRSRSYNVNGNGR